MNHDEAAAAREILVQILPVRLLDVARFLLVEDEDVGLVELRLRGKRLRTGRSRAALVEQRHPFLEVPRIVVRAGPMRLRPRADEHPQRLLGGSADVGRREDAMPEMIPDMIMEAIAVISATGRTERFMVTISMLHAACEADGG